MRKLQELGWLRVQLADQNITYFFNSKLQVTTDVNLCIPLSFARITDHIGVGYIVKLGSHVFSEDQEVWLQELSAGRSSYFSESLVNHKERTIVPVDRRPPLHVNGTNQTPLNLENRECSVTQSLKLWLDVHHAS